MTTILANIDMPFGGSDTSVPAIMKKESVLDVEVCFSYSHVCNKIGKTPEMGAPTMCGLIRADP